MFSTFWAIYYNTDIQLHIIHIIITIQLNMQILPNQLCSQYVLYTIHTHLMWYIINNTYIISFYTKNSVAFCVSNLAGKFAKIKFIVHVWTIFTVKSRLVHTSIYVNNKYSKQGYNTCRIKICANMNEIVSVPIILPISHIL